MKKTFLFFVLIYLGIALNSCNDNTAEPDAIPMTIEELAATPGYLWIYDVLSGYKGDSLLVPQISQKLDTTRDKFLIFARASCSCASEKKEFAYLVKILRDLNFPTSKYEIYAMSSKSNHHPYESLFTLKEIPAIIYLRNGVPYYSIMDTLQYNIDHLIPYPLKIEELLLEALKKP